MTKCIASRASSTHDALTSTELVRNGVEMRFANEQEAAQVAIGVAGREEIIAYGRHESRLDAIALGLAQARAVIAACVKIDQSDARSPCCSAAIRCGRCGHDLAYVGAAS